MCLYIVGKALVNQPDKIQDDIQLIEQRNIVSMIWTEMQSDPPNEDPVNEDTQWGEIVSVLFKMYMCHGKAIQSDQKSDETNF